MTETIWMKAVLAKAVVPKGGDDGNHLDEGSFKESGRAERWCRHNFGESGFGAS